ncbi:bifunctional 5,10-methylenetetrahydrofolate dehydrogenase/5,10-methenyltetrahydrofolate cyclohydrolase [Acidobacteriota bacterium]
MLKRKWRRTVTAKIIDGEAVATGIREQLAGRVKEIEERYGFRPGLATVLVGENPASQQYVRMKQNRSKKVGIQSYGNILPAESSQEEVEGLVRKLGKDPNVHGILVQLPLPDHLDEEAVLNAIPLPKDVDGFHPVNIGRLAMKGRKPLFIPCTPAGVIRLLEEAGAVFDGAEAVVLGRSNIVGMPAAMLLIHRNATVTVCHSRTNDLPGVCRRADILVAAVGRPLMVKSDWVKPGAFVIDVGSNRIDDPDSERGYRWVGDVDFDEVKDVAAAISPSPGGVGPMTIAGLLQNTVRAADLAIKRSDIPSP